MEGFKNTTKMKYMTEGGTFNERGRRATMGEIAAEDRRMANAAPKKAVGPSSVAVSKVLAGMTKKATGGSVSGTSTAATTAAATTAANPKAGFRTLSQFKADSAATNAAMRDRIAANKTKREANLGKSEYGRQLLAREKKNEPAVAAERAKQQAARDANLGKTFVGRQVLAQRKSEADLAKGITPPSSKYTPERMAEIKAKAKSHLDRYAAELAAKGPVTKKATGGSVNNSKKAPPRPAPPKELSPQQILRDMRRDKGSGPNDGGPMPTSFPSKPGGVKTPKTPKTPVKPSRPAPPPRIPKSVLADYERGLPPKGPMSPKPDPIAEHSIDLGPSRFAKGGMTKKGVPAYSGKPMIGRKTSGFAVMPKGKC